jgi:hypothetical protein
VSTKDWIVEVGVLELEPREIITDTNGIRNSEEPVLPVLVLVVNDDALAPVVVCLVPDEFEDPLHRLVVNDRLFIEVEDPVEFGEAHCLAVPLEGAGLVLGVVCPKVLGAGVAIDVFKKVGFISEDVDADRGMESLKVFMSIPRAIDGLQCMSEMGDPSEKESTAYLSVVTLCDS